MKRRHRQVREGPEDRHSGGIPAWTACRRNRELWQQGIAWLKDAGAEIVDIAMPHTKYALPAYYIVAPGGSLVEPRPL
jgi:Asp-tRNA(Asn)/Glu-tRNA(Gln) amidotransferase A subunit family amidase